MFAAAAIIAILALMWHLSASPGGGARGGAPGGGARGGAPPAKNYFSPLSYGADWTQNQFFQNRKNDTEGASCGEGSVPEAAPGAAGVSAPIDWGERNEIGAYGANVISLGAAEAARLSPAQRDLAPAPTVRDGTVAPPSRKSVPNMVRAGLGARSAAVAAYRDAPDPTADRDLGLGRLVWARAAADRQAPAPAATPALGEVQEGTWRGAPLPGTLVRLDTRTGAESDWGARPPTRFAIPESSARPMSLPSWHLAAAGAGSNSSNWVVNPDFVTDGPFGAAMAFAAQ
jgi:hypothetical protein